MKNKFFVAGAVFIVLTAFLYFFVPGKITGMITDYTPYTFEQVLQNEALRADYGIREKQSPEDYGFDEVEEFTLPSLYDSIALNTWFVNSAKSSKSIVMVHGRTSNRLKTMKYLELFKEASLDTSYNILIPDLRNSGKSAPAKTFMGYKFAEDLLTYLLYLKQEKQQDTVILYGFSMGAMAILTMMNRPDLKKELQGSGMMIEKIIMDSPLSNVKATLRKNADEMNLPDFVFESAFEKFSNKIEHYGEKMTLSYLIREVNTPVLILQGTQDKTTPVEILKGELKEIDKDNLMVVYFDNAEHVKAFQDARSNKAYSEAVETFIRK